MNVRNQEEQDLKISFDAFKEQILSDYKIAVTSRECSVLGRREVFSGKGKFGIFGDGKEVPQLVMNHFFKNGDFRSGYYRDQTLLMAQGQLSVSNIFSALYADLDLDREPMSGGRQMGGYRPLDPERTDRRRRIRRHGGQRQKHGRLIQKPGGPAAARCRGIAGTRRTWPESALGR